MPTTESPTARDVTIATEALLANERNGGKNSTAVASPTRPCEPRGPVDADLSSALQSAAEMHMSLSRLDFEAASAALMPLVEVLVSARGQPANRALHALIGRIAFARSFAMHAESQWQRHALLLLHNAHAEFTREDA